MACEGDLEDGSGTLGFFARKGEYYGLVTNKHIAWHHGCKLVNFQGVHIATVEDTASDVDAAFAQLEKNQVLKMLPGMCSGAVKDMKVCFLSWKHNKGANVKLHCSEGMEVIDNKGAFTITCKKVKVESICAEAGIREHSITISDVKSKFLGNDEGFKVRCRFSSKVSCTCMRNGTGEQFEGIVESELEGLAEFSNPDGEKIDNAPVKGRMKGDGTFKGKWMTDGKDANFRRQINRDFEGVAVEKVVMYEGHIRFERLYSSKDIVGEPGQSGSLLRDGEDTNDAVGLVFAGRSPNVGWAIPMEKVLEELGNIEDFFY